MWTGEGRSDRPLWKNIELGLLQTGLAMGHHRARVFGGHGRDGIKYMFWSPAGSDSNLIPASSGGVTFALPVPLKRENSADS